MSINRSSQEWPAGMAHVLNASAADLAHREEALHHAQAWGYEAIVRTGFENGTMAQVTAQQCAVVAAHFARLYLRMRRTRER